MTPGEMHDLHAGIGRKRTPLSERVRFNTTADQPYRSMGDGQTKTVRYVGRCEVCRVRVYDDGDDNDPRGACGLHTDATLKASEHGLLRDVRICYGCAQEFAAYKVAIALGRAEVAP